MDSELIKIIKRVNSHMLLKYNIPLFEMDITESKGYWRNKNECDPATCSSPLHTFMGNDGGIKHTMTYHDNYRGNDGRFKSVYSSWLAIKQATDAGDITDEIIRGVCSC